MRHMLMATILLLAGAVAATAQVSTQPSAQEVLALQHLRAGQDALQQEHWDEAEREFKASLGLDPRLELAHYGLGQTYMATKRYAEAVIAYTKCKETFHANTAERLGDSVEAERRFEDQIRSLRDARHALETGRVRASNPQAVMKLDEQIEQLEGMRRRGHDSKPPTPPYITTALGSAYFRTSAFDAAEREWREAIAVDPSVGEVHNNLAVLCMLTGRYDEADKEVALAEKHGVKVSPQLKADIKAKKGSGKSRA